MALAMSTKAIYYAGYRFGLFTALPESTIMRLQYIKKYSVCSTVFMRMPSRSHKQISSSTLQLSADVLFYFICAPLFTINDCFW